MIQLRCISLLLYPLIIHLGTISLRRWPSRATTRLPSFHLSAHVRVLVPGCTTQTYIPTALQILPKVKKTEIYLIANSTRTRLTLSDHIDRIMLYRVINYKLSLFYERGTEQSYRMPFFM